MTVENPTLKLEIEVPQEMLFEMFEQAMFEVKNEDAYIKLINSPKFKAILAKDIWETYEAQHWDDCGEGFQYFVEEKLTDVPGVKRAIRSVEFND